MKNRNRIFIKAGNYKRGNMALKDGIIIPSGGQDGKWSLMVELWDYADQHEQLVFSCNPKDGVIDTLDMVAKEYPSKYGVSVVLEDL